MQRSLFYFLNAWLCSLLLQYILRLSLAISIAIYNCAVNAWCLRTFYSALLRAAFLFYFFNTLLFIRLLQCLLCLSLATNIHKFYRAVNVRLEGILFSITKCSTLCFIFFFRIHKHNALNGWCYYIESIFPYLVRLTHSFLLGNEGIPCNKRRWEFFGTFPCTHFHLPFRIYRSAIRPRWIYMPHNMYYCNTDFPRICMNKVRNLSW